MVVGVEAGWQDWFSMAWVSCLSSSLSVFLSLSSRRRFLGIPLFPTEIRYASSIDRVLWAFAKTILSSSSLHSMVHRMQFCLEHSQRNPRCVGLAHFAFQCDLFCLLRDRPFGALMMTIPSFSASSSNLGFALGYGLNTPAGAKLMPFSRASSSARCSDRSTLVMK